jgi:hypothetical protein
MTRIIAPVDFDGNISYLIRSMELQFLTMTLSWTKTWLFGPSIFTASEQYLVCQYMYFCNYVAYPEVT